MKDIVIIANFCRGFSENDGSRFSYLGDLLSTENDVEVITSDFNHATKKKREEPLAHWPFKITFISEPGYPKNVCLYRFYSHWRLSQNIVKYLKTRKRPNIIYCAVPSLDVAYAAAKYAKRNNIRLIIDVQDLWPEAFRMVFHVPVLSNIIFIPMKRKANRIYAAADDIVAVSQTYADRALRVNDKCEKATVVFLGTDLARFDELRKDEPLMQKPDEEIWMAYIGTLGHSYDLTCVMDAMVLLRDEKKTQNLRFIVMGDGPLKERFENYAKNLCLPVIFTGRLSYSEMVPQLCECDFAVNPIISGSAGSIINKVGDYAAAGLAVINTQECNEYQVLIKHYRCGINCRCGKAAEVAEAIRCLIADSELSCQMGLNHRRLAEERFDRMKTYHQITTLLNGIESTGCIM